MGVATLGKAGRGGGTLLSLGLLARQTARNIHTLLREGRGGEGRGGEGRGGREGGREGLTSFS